MFVSLKNSLTKFFHQKSQARPHSFRPQLEALEDRLVMSATFPTPSNQQGGTVITNVKVETVFYGQAWTNPADPHYAELTAESKDLQNYFATLTNSPYMDGLQQYSGPNGSPGRGQFLGANWVNANIGPNVSQKNVEGMLQNEILNDPVNMPAADNNTLYFVYLPPNVHLQDSWAGGGNQHDAFHASFVLPNGQTVYYVMVTNPIDPNGTSNPNPNGYSVSTPSGVVYYNPDNTPVRDNHSDWRPGNATDLQTLTIISSHEMVEAITNPTGGSIANPKGNSWFDYTPPPNYYWAEIGDEASIGLASLPGFAGYQPLAMVDGYVVQKYWSIKDKTGIAAADANHTTTLALIGTGTKSLQNILPPAAVSSLTGITFNLYTLQSGKQTDVGVYFSTETQDTSLDAYGNPVSNPGHTLVQVWWGGQQAYADVVVNGDRLDLIIYTLTPGGGHTTLFTGSIAAPDGNWYAGSDVGNLELQGQQFVNGQAIDAFGWQENYNNDGGGGGSTSGSSGNTGAVDNPNTTYQTHRKPNQQ